MLKNLATNIKCYREIFILLPKPKKNPKKAIFDKTKKLHPRFLESSESEGSGFLSF